MVNHVTHKPTTVKLLGARLVCLSIEQLLPCVHTSVWHKSEPVGIECNIRKEEHQFINILVRYYRIRRYSLLRHKVVTARMFLYLEYKTAKMQRNIKSAMQKSLLRIQHPICFNKAA